MKKLFVLVTMMVVLAGAVNAFAYSVSINPSVGTYDNPNSGVYMFTMSGNEENYKPDYTDIVTEINKWFSQNGIVRTIESLTEYSKIDLQGTPTELSNAFMTITFDAEWKSGTWTTQLPIEFYSVKGSNEFAFYWEEGLAKEGSWNVGNLRTNSGKIPQISHLSAWNPGETNPVPEPGTVILLGLGLLGVAGLARNKMKKN